MLESIRGNNVECPACDSVYSVLIDVYSSMRIDFFKCIVCGHILRDVISSDAYVFILQEVGQKPTE